MIIDYVGNIDYETTTANDLKKGVSDAVTAIQTQLSSLDSSWKDQKSEEFLSSAKDIMTKLIAANTQCVDGINAALNSIQEALNIYQL